MTIIKRKEFKTNEELYNVIPGVMGNGSVAYLADLPKGAIVTGVYVNGKSLEDYKFEGYSHNGEHHSTIYPKSAEFEGHSVVAVFIDETCGGELYNLAVSGGIECFVVEYIETAVAEVM